MGYVRMLFEVGVYNQRVRDCIRGGDDWKNDLGISKAFEEVLYFEFTSKSKAALKKALDKEFPPTFGYIIECIIEVKDNE